MLYDAEIMLAFIEEIAEYVPQLRQHLGKLTVKPKDKEALEEAYRLAHTIKGSAAMLELDDLSAEGKHLEQTLLPVVEKKAPFTPDLGVTLLGHVDKVEWLLAKVKAEVTGEPVSPEPAVAAVAAPPPPPPPPSAAAEEFGFEVPEAPPIGFNQTLVPPPPPPPSLYNSTRSTVPAPAPEPQPAPFTPPNNPVVRSPGLPDKVSPPPPPPLPDYLYNFDDLDEDLDLAGQFPPPPPLPGEIIPRASNGQIPPPPPVASDFDFDFDLDGLQAIPSFDLDDAALPPPPPPPPPYLYGGERQFNLPSIPPAFEAAPEIKPAGFSQSAETWEPFAPFETAEETLPNLPPVLPPLENVNRTATSPRSDDLDLMDLMFESNELDTSPSNLGDNITAPPPPPNLRLGATAPLTDRRFAWTYEPVVDAPPPTTL